MRRILPIFVLAAAFIYLVADCTSMLECRDKGGVWIRDQWQCLQVGRR